MNKIQGTNLLFIRDKNGVELNIDISSDVKPYYFSGVTEAKVFGNDAWIFSEKYKSPHYDPISNTLRHRLFNTDTGEQAYLVIELNSFTSIC